MQRYNLIVVVLETENGPAHQYPTYNTPSFQPSPHTYLDGETHWYAAWDMAGLESSRSGILPAAVFPLVDDCPQRSGLPKVTQPVSAESAQQSPDSKAGLY